MRIFFFILIIFSAHPILAQKEDFQWIFRLLGGDSLNNLQDPSIRHLLGTSVLDFRTNPPSSYRTEKITMDFLETNTSLCDENGEIILYSNGQTIHGSDFKPIINGEQISFGFRWEQFASITEDGNLRPYGFPFDQFASLVPVPGNENAFFIFYKNYDIRGAGDYNLLYEGTIVQHDDGSWEMIKKDVFVNNEIYQFGHTSMCQHANGRDWWMIQTDRTKALIFLIDPDGIRLEKTQDLDVEILSYIGSAKFSKDGSKYAIHGLHDLDEPVRRELVIFDFDRCTGALSNGKINFYDEVYLTRSFPIEFSPEGRFIYINTHLKIYQYDLWEENIFNSEIIVAEWDGYDIDLLGNPNFPSQFSRMSKGPDDKIYCVSTGQGLGIHVIHYPDRKGKECQVEQRSIILPTYVYGTIPNHNTLRLGPIDGSECDTLGNDNNPVSHFRYEQDSTDFLNIDFVDLSYYRPESWYWEFGDSGTSTLPSPSHVYSEDGIYEVCLTVSNENSTHRSCDTLNLGIVNTVDIQFDFDISLYPNPVEDLTRIAFHNYFPRNAVIRIMDNQGKSVIKDRLSDADHVIDLTSLSAGLYFFEILDQGKTLKSGQLVKI